MNITSRTSFWSVSNAVPPAGTAPAFAWGVVASAVTGVLAIYIVFRVVKARSYAPFVVYRVLAGLAVLGVIISGFRSAS